MKTRNCTIVATIAALLIVLMSGAAATGVAQTPKPSTGEMPERQEGMQRMSGMMGAPHHMLAMAYRDNLVTFARALERQVTQSKTVNLDLAKPAVAEMRRSFDQMKEHHQAQMAMMGDHADQPMSGAVQRMETHLTDLGEHLTALESEVNARVPDPKKVSEHTTEILKQCAEMSAMPAKATPHHMN